MFFLSIRLPLGPPLAFHYSGKRETKYGTLYFCVHLLLLVGILFQKDRVNQLNKNSSRDSELSHVASVGTMAFFYLTLHINQLIFFFVFIAIPWAIFFILSSCILIPLGLWVSIPPLTLLQAIETLPFSWLGLRLLFACVNRLIYA